MNNFFKNLSSDMPSGLVVFLVALPLCLGIALASGAPLFSGIIAGIVGGIIVGALSGSQVSVSGPAAGLTVIVLNAITSLGTFESFLLAVVLAGLFQFILGLLNAGIIGHFFPSSVIKGMLSAIGLILILKQIPHALGDDRDYEGDEHFFQPDGENTFTEIALALQNIDPGALIICLVSLVILIGWEKKAIKSQPWSKMIPGPLVAVVAGIAINQFLYGGYFQNLFLSDKHLVSLPESDSISEFFAVFTFPDFSRIVDLQVWTVAATIAIIASLETLLSLDAADKLDPYKRIAPANKELKAQGVGNLVSGLIGGLPVTAVIVRSTANISSGAKSKFSAIFHGFLLALSVIFFPHVLNLIPLSALAAILLTVGYKLASPTVFRDQYDKGFNQFLPFVITVIAILLTDLLIGILIGIVVGLYFVLKANMHRAITVTKKGDNEYTVSFEKDVSFLNKAFLRISLRDIPQNSIVTIDESHSIFIDKDIAETVEDFMISSKTKGIKVIFNQPENSRNFKFVREEVYEI